MEDIVVRKKTHMVRSVLDTDLYNRLRELCRREEYTESQLVRLIIKRYFAGQIG